MDISQYLDKHITFNAHDEVARLCQPLRNLGIVHFDYARVYRDSSRVHLGNNPAWIKHFFENYYTEDLLYFEDFVYAKPGIVMSNLNFWNKSYPDETLFSTISTQFNIDNGVSLSIYYRDYIEKFYIATELNNKKIFDIFLKKYDLIKGFIFFFKEKAHQLIHKAESQKLMSPKKSEDKPTLTFPNADVLTMSDFFQQVDIEKFYLGGEYKDIFLTKKERSCISWIAKGKTAEETGTILGNTKRTIETHLEMIKTKLGVFKISEVIRILAYFDILEE